MLTRLKINGFKNLVDVDIRFGPFNCIAGPNGVGKSNLFDAIQFLSALADRPLLDAALSVRDEGGRTADIRSLFHRVGDETFNQMDFEAEMIVPQEGFDELGQRAKATITLLRYSISLALREDEKLQTLSSLELLKEELVHINIGDATKHLLFPHVARSWRKSVLKGRRASPFISTDYKDKDNTRIIKLHQDGGPGRARSFPARSLPRTVLSASETAESPTALMAKREMQSWRLLQLEPSSLRRPDEFNAPTRLSADGSHLAATLHHLAHLEKRNGDKSKQANSKIYAELANRLSELIDDVAKIWIDEDKKRELFVLNVIDHNGTNHPARSLSDGTLRFLALAVLEQDSESHGLICLEEPENGIHPDRIPAMIQLLRDIATDPEEEVGSDNPLRQVIVNTHSPAVVSQVPDDSLLIAELRETKQQDRYFQKACFGCLPATWRANAPENTHLLAKSRLMAYLNPIVPPRNGFSAGTPKGRSRNSERRVVDRPDMKPLFPLTDEKE